MRKLLLPVLLSAAAACAADASLANLLPAGPRMVAGLNMSQSANSPLGRYLLNQMKDDDAGLRKFVEATGFDPRKDLREIIVANYDGPTPAKGNTLVVAKGNFETVRTRASFLKDHTVSQLVGGFEILSGKDGAGAVAFLDPATAVAGDLAQVKDALSARGRLAADVQTRIAQMSTRYDAWIFTTTPMSSFAGKISTDQPGAKALNGGQLLQGILQANGGVRFGNTVTMDAELLARSPKDAQALMDVFKFITSMLQLGKENPGAKSEGLAALLEGMKLSVTGETVTLNFSVPEIELERILETGKALQRKPARTGVGVGVGVI